MGNQIFHRPLIVALAALFCILLLSVAFMTFGGNGTSNDSLVRKAPAATATATPSTVDGTPAPNGETPPATEAPTAVPTATPVPATPFIGTPPPVRTPLPAGPPTPEPTPFPNPTTIDTDGDGEPDTETNLDSCVETEDCTCDSFESYSEAVAVYQKFAPDDPFDLDEDNDGMPCEQSPYAPR